MADGKRNIDIGFVVIRKDPETGRPYTTTLPDGSVIETPLIALNAYNLPDDVKLRFAFWDFDNSQLPTRYSAPVTGEEHETFFAAMHSRMQEWLRDGGPARLAEIKEKDDQIAMLQAQVRRNGQNAGAND